MQVLLRDLAPGQDYAIQFRSNDGKGNTSEWSQVQRFTTTSDTMPPANVQQLSVFASGASFMAQWDAVTKNADGSNLLDFRYYHINVTSIAGAGAVDFYSFTEHFELTQSANITAFGTYQTALTFKVTAVDLNYNESVLPATVNVDPAAPPMPSTPTVTNYLGLLLVSWDGKSSVGAAMPGNTVQVEIHASTVTGFTPTTATQVGTLDVGTTNRKFVISGLTYGTTYYIRLIAVNSISKKSPASAQASGVPTRISGLDISNGQISPSQINFSARDIGGANAYFGTSKPTVAISTAGFKTGDIWYDTAHGYATYRYDSSAGDFVSAPEIGVIAGTKILAGTVTADAVGTNLLITSSANIGTAVIDQANIGSVNAASIVAGTMSADVLIGGRFTTALSGARVEVNSLGFQKFDVDGVTKLISLTGSEALITGVHKTALTGRRIEMGAAGQTGEIAFYAPDGTKSRITALTVTNGATSFGESMLMGVPVSGLSSSWNHIEIDAGEVISFASQYVTSLIGGHGRNGDGGFTVYWSDTTDITSLIARFSINNSGSTLSSQNGNSTILLDESFGVQINSGGVGRAVYTTTASVTYGQGTNYNLLYGYGNGSGSIGDGNLLANYNLHGSIGFFDQVGGGSAYSPLIRFSTGDGYAMAWRGVHDTGLNAILLEAVDWSQTQFCAVRAQTFISVSDERTKTNIANYEGSALADVVSTPVRSYNRLVNKDNSDEGELTPHPISEIGLVAQEAPSQIVAKSVTGPQSIDLYQMATLMWAALQEIHGRITKLEEKDENNE